VSSPLHKRKAPLLKTFWRRFCLEIQALQVHRQNPTTYFAEKGFSALVIDWYQDKNMELSS